MSEPSSDIPFAVAGTYPVRTGNLVRPLVDGEPAFRRICEAVESARHSVWVTVTFIRAGFLMPDGRGSFFDALDGAVERGLDVRVILR
jgi:cardiolipin synthase